ncbi:Serine/threonine-protein kinase WNK2 [Hondaea fermentalgiana]|uniref:non-specific serine/threonine protein kinase n=1 Tax=Hondaea fermentalgiana TaxID=2315210 RepID=A0A2R5GWE7_9STRA|nr:Serine/threonine-protein kinase WNK2 [Hondaea fermentalgiana]|eukprot:GBG32264.1 Serine/threonine-protein kinase WNK2 [Hondaea fermentalgiana]
MTNVAPCVENPVEPPLATPAVPTMDAETAAAAEEARCRRPAASPPASPTQSPLHAPASSCSSSSSSTSTTAATAVAPSALLTRAAAHAHAHAHRLPRSFDESDNAGWSPAQTHAQTAGAAPGHTRTRSNSSPVKYEGLGAQRQHVEYESYEDAEDEGNMHYDEDDDEDDDDEDLSSGGKRNKKVVESSPKGRYVRFNDLLGEGSFKRVYRAWDSNKGREVAWNTVSFDSSASSSGGARRVIQEMQILQTLKHDKIIKFWGSWLNHKKMTVVFITELISSGTLQDFIQDRPVCLNVLKRWCRDILDALVYLHGHQPPIIHRDIKCENVFINGCTGDLRIGDLGLASWRRDNLRKQSILGTPEYMAPELYDEHYDEKVDIYAFGMCVMEMVVKESPYSECDSAGQIFRKVTRGELPAAFSRITYEPLIRFIGKCIRQPDEGASRPSASELLQDEFLQEQDSDEGLDCATFVFASPDDEAEHTPSVPPTPPLVAHKETEELAPSRPPGTLERFNSEATESLPMSDSASAASVRLDGDAVVVLEMEEEAVPDDHQHHVEQQHVPQDTTEPSSSPVQQQQQQQQQQQPQQPQHYQQPQQQQPAQVARQDADPLVRLASTPPIPIEGATLHHHNNQHNQALASGHPQRPYVAAHHDLPPSCALATHADGTASPLSYSSGSTFHSMEHSAGSDPLAISFDGQTVLAPPAVSTGTGAPVAGHRLSSLSSPPRTGAHVPLHPTSSDPLAHAGHQHGTSVSGTTMPGPYNSDHSAILADQAVRSSSTGELPLPSESGYPVEMRSRRDSDWLCSAHPSETIPNSIQVVLTIRVEGKRQRIEFAFDLTESPSETVCEMVREGALPSNMPESELKVLTSQLEHFRTKFSQAGSTARHSTFRDRSSSSTSLASGSSGSSADQDEALREDLRRKARERIAAEKEQERKRCQAEIEDLERKLKEPFFMESAGLLNSNASHSVISGASSVSSCNTINSSGRETGWPAPPRSIR